MSWIFSHFVPALALEQCLVNPSASHGTFYILLFLCLAARRIRIIGIRIRLNIWWIRIRNSLNTLYLYRYRYNHADTYTTMLTRTYKNMLTRLQPCWHVYNHADTCTTMLTRVKPCWHVYNHADTFTTMLAHLQPCWHVYNRAGMFTTMLKRVQSCWYVYNHAGTHVQPCLFFLQPSCSCTTMLSYVEETCVELCGQACNHAASCTVMRSRVPPCPPFWQCASRVT